jgi:hypothetical protein
MHLAFYKCRAYINEMQNVADVLAAWPSDAEFGRDIGVPYPTVSAWKQRGSIPAAYWWHIVRAATHRGHPEITADLLARLHARKVSDNRPSGFAEEGQLAMLETQEVPKREDRPNGTMATGHFSRWKHLRRASFASPAEIAAHIDALREEWDRR